jgi:hypothetical protein
MRGVVVGDFTFTGNSNNSLSTSSTTTTVELRNNITSECTNKVYSYAYSKEFLKTQHKDIV